MSGRAGSTPEFEEFLVRLYSDDQVRERFLADPRGEAMAAGLSGEQVLALESIDRVGLRLAADSFARKREGKAGRRKVGLLERLWNH